MTFDIKAAALAYLADKQKGFAHNRLLTVGASEIGQCAQKIWRIKKGTKPDKTYKQTHGAGHRGDILEDEYTTKIIEHAIAGTGAALRFAGKGQQTTVIANEWRLSATPDGLITGAPRDLLSFYGITDILSDCVVVELKSFDPRIGDKLPKQEHQDQANVQLGLLRKEGTFAPAFALLIYVNASFLDDIRVFPVMFNKITFENQIRRALQIMNANSADQLRPEGKIAGERECLYCPFAQQCLGYVPRVPGSEKDFEELPKGQKIPIMSLVGTIDNQTGIVKRAEAKIEAAKAELREALENAKTRKARGKLSDGRQFYVDWRKTAPRDVPDMEKITDFLTDQGEDPADYMKESKPGERLTVRLTEHVRADKGGPQ